jgi:hypothetical protein
MLGSHSAKQEQRIGTRPHHFELPFSLFNDAFGELVEALEKLWDTEHELDWCNRTRFLKP